ncbi:class I SAM-dependent methyltransferase [Cognatishimia sp. MH4019]|uniref:class I SAM-dependent methyltransferase n=1 Tax=Cognatishimia sp. MH4019 TaxID=2854030 RepID=UPI001CD7800B|nr:SAM-dependent methyltransferase [Cognatishimia sp. MH4019]
MTALKAELIAQIRANGPMSVAEFMTTCLLHPTHGYYTTRQAFGADGDFITAPEISQMFGELVGLALAQSWLDQGAPDRFTLAELGPGRGTLMADALRATKAVPGFHDAAEIVLLEASPTLRIQQLDTVPQARHIDTLADLPDQPLYLIANEFFDALPIRQFQRDGAGWREKRVGVQDDTLSFGLTDPTPQDALAHRLEDTKDGDLVEVSPAAATLLSEIGTRITQHGGAALIIDYGDWRSLGDTLQAMADHAPTDPLANPGHADLTAHVDFEALAQAAPCAHTRLTPQGVWLERLGITARAQALAQNLSGAALDSHIGAHRRLTHPSEMGTLFKVLGLYPTGQPPPAGLEP